MQPQEGVILPPQQHSLVRLYQFEDLPLIAMNVARIGAQTPSLASELGKGKVRVTIGFGPKAWLMITPDSPAPGFKTFGGSEKEGKIIPETNGDLLLFFSSGSSELNKILADHVGDHFGGDGELIEEFIGEGGDYADLSAVKEKILLNNGENPDVVQSSFVLTQRFDSIVENPTDLPRHRFSYRDASKSGSYTLTYSNNPLSLDQQSVAEMNLPVSRGLFFLPSLDLLTSLRMGGIRMGSLAINAKWKT